MSTLNSVSSISYLPKEEGVRVLSYLTPKEQLTTRKVSTTWNNLSQDRSGLFALVQSMAGIRSEDIKKMHDSNPKAFEVFLDRIVKTNFNPSLDPDNKFMSGFFYNILRYKSDTDSEEMMHWLRTLPLQKKAAVQDLYIKSPITDEQLAEVFKICPSLKELHFVGGVTGKGFLHIPENSQLESITLFSNNLEEQFLSALFSKATKLKSIFINFPITDKQLADILVKCPTLKNLYLTGVNITGAGLSNIPANNQLESISLSFGNFDEGFLSSFFSKAIKLKSIFLSSSNITGKALCHIPVNNQLECVVLNLCTNLKEDHLIKFFSKATTLKEVCLDLASMTGEGLASIPLNNQLKFISINNCTNLEEAALWEFLAKANKAIKIRYYGLSNPLTKIVLMFQTLIQGADTKLHLKPKEIINFLHHLPMSKKEEVQSLDFTDGSGTFTSVKEEEIATLLQLCPNVKFLNVFLHTGKGLSHIPENNKLEKLTLTITHPDEESLAQFFSKVKNLKEIDFSYSRTTGKGLSHLPRDNQLGKVVFFNCKKLDEEALATLFEKGAMLKEADFHCSNTSCKGLSHLPKNNQLEILDLRFCRFDPEFFKIVSEKATKLKNVKLSLLR
ncbi:MAG: hypothetical protein COT84_08160 [Chlamydiae bacterium CG10_big_fil_rev_8_21_14_0_10_35_9]|nr:MAG: hypothetical protein COT84_08160 [Chlamydiae bacterium CG10_big_fil_rev_8_21_14_0_10_35_9]